MEYEYSIVLDAPTLDTVGVSSIIELARANSREALEPIAVVLRAQRKHLLHPNTLVQVVVWNSPDTASYTAVEDI